MLRLVLGSLGLLVWCGTHFKNISKSQTMSNSFWCLHNGLRNNCLSASTQWNSWKLGRWVPISNHVRSQEPAPPNNEKPPQTVMFDSLWLYVASGSLVTAALPLLYSWLYDRPIPLAGSTVAVRSGPVSSITAEASKNARRNIVGSDF
jgi:hypothetical protein